MVERGIRDELQDVINTVMANRTEMTGHWIALVESYDEDGRRSVYISADKDATAWDTMGLLEYGRDVERADVIAERLSQENS